MKEKFEKLVNTHKKLRKDCPWDKEQDFDSLKKTVIEEANEVVEAIEKKDYDNLKEELGDLLHNILFIANIAEEKNLFAIKDVIEDIHSKLIRRHPHIFGNEKASTPEEAAKIWKKVKMAEKNG